MPTPPLAPEAHRSDRSVLPTLLDPQLEERFRRDGYVVLDALDEDDLALARRCWEEIHTEPGTGFVYDVVRRSPEATARLEAAIGPAWDALLERTLVGHDRFLLSFLTKWPGPDSAHHLHQDWTYVDERRYRTMSYWIALDDCTEELGNGPVSVIPGSHHLVDAYRGPAVVDWYHELVADLEPLLQPVPMRAGQAILLDSAVLHGSAPNRSAAPRRGLAAAVAPKEASYWFVAPGDDDRVVIHDLGPRYFSGFDPDDPDIAERSVLARAPRLLAVDADALVRTVGRDLPDDLGQAPDPDRPAASGTDVARAVALDLEEAFAAGWALVPAAFLPRWAPGVDPVDRLLPLAHEGHPTSAGRDAFRRTTAALAAQQPGASAWLVEVRPESTWTQLAPRPDSTLTAVLAGGGAIAGSVSAEGHPLTTERRALGSSIRIANASAAPAWVLVTASNAGAPSGRFRRRHRRQEADEAVAAVRPKHPGARP